MVPHFASLMRATCTRRAPGYMLTHPSVLFTPCCCPDLITSSRRLHLMTHNLCSSGIGHPKETTMTHLKTILSSALLCGALGAAPAAAMPVNNLAAAAPSNVENVRL